MELLTVDREIQSGAVIVHVQGEIDLSTVDELVLHLTAARQQATKQPARVVIIDLHAVTYFGSAGLNAVLDCHKAGHGAGTSVRLVADNRQVLAPIEVTNLDSVFELYPTLTDALPTVRP